MADVGPRIIFPQTKKAIQLQLVRIQKGKGKKGYKGVQKGTKGQRKRIIVKETYGRCRRPGDHLGSDKEGISMIVGEGTKSTTKAHVIDWG